MHPRVICLGEILFDRISNQPGLPLEAVTTWTDYPGGAPANVACALTKLGTPSAFVGAVGDDDLGRSLTELLNTLKVDTSGVQIYPAPTRTVLVLRSQTNDRSFVAFGENRDTSEFADTQLQGNLIPVELFQHADYLVLGTLLMAYPRSRVAIERALQLAEQFFVKVVLDVNWRPVFWKDQNIAPALIHDLIKRADFLKMAEEEAAWLFDTTDPGVIAHRVESLEGVLVTAGEKGCSYCLNQREGKIPAFSIDVEDTTGAGDSFLAGFVHQLCQHQLSEINHDAEHIVKYASAAGALTTLKAGAIAAQPTGAEVDAFLFLDQQAS
ncbi:carbohydrate kinase family protein [Leptolyngbya sp. GGD]|uniref:carbohydrate kinase family protein n=1 Tax=Leptolyngbya sp. GGD TaxID=2997907 RepID=UPI00227A5D0A|nr:carbohydrate kinase [Leptolyngbya sp. GGD]MCY6493748.1 carbohydrate kinase [Leptolyngbya sp. GGD]